MKPILSFPRADSWDGEYVRSGVQILGELTDNEDMFLWRDDRGGVHMLTHSQDNSHHNHERRGGYAFSPDNGLSWKLSKVCTDFIAWNEINVILLLEMLKEFGVWMEDYIVFDDCGGVGIHKRQRPSLIFHPETGSLIETEVSIPSVVM